MYYSSKFFSKQAVNTNFRFPWEKISKFRWTVDYEEDYEFIKKIYQNLYKINKVFGMNDILELLNKNKKLNEINSKYVGFHNIDSPKIQKNIISKEIIN